MVPTTLLRAKRLCCPGLKSIFPKVGEQSGKDSTLGHPQANLEGVNERECMVARGKVSVPRMMPGDRQCILPVLYASSICV